MVETALYSYARIAMLEGRFSKAKFGGQAEFSILAFQKTANFLQAVLVMASTLPKPALTAHSS